MDDAAIESPGVALVPITCPTHGEYQAYRVPNQPLIANDCPHCIDQRQQREDRDRKARAEQQARGRRLKEILEIAGIPARFADKTLADYRASTPGQARAVAICQAYERTWVDQLNKGGSLVLTGLPGTGKTHLACAIANEIMPKHLATVAFGTVASVMLGIRSTYGKHSDKSELQALADLQKPDLLIMDEVGVQSDSEHAKQMLFHVINKRYENLRPMILISNLNADDLLKFLGHRVMDRFKECGTVVAFDWESYRGKVVS